MLDNVYVYVLYVCSRSARLRFLTLRGLGATDLRLRFLPMPEVLDDARHQLYAASPLRPGVAGQ